MNIEGLNKKVRKKQSRNLLDSRVADLPYWLKMCFAYLVEMRNYGYGEINAKFHKTGNDNVMCSLKVSYNELFNTGKSVKDNLSGEGQEEKDTS